MANDVRLCVMSMSARSAAGDDAAYLEWHSLDHLPEQYSIPSLVHGQRWVSTPACRAVRAPGDARLDGTDHVVQYLFAEPVAPALDRFFALGAELREAGRMPLLLPPVELGAYELRETRATLVSASVLPWRPCRGVYIVVGEVPVSLEALAEVEGIAGAWVYAGGQFHPRLADTSGRWLTVCYLDGDPAAVAAQLRDRVGGAMFAAPFVPLTAFDWSRSLP
ncbi:MAG TPA: hypothetical protein VMZ22_10485 [Acidimicrobiales bacterium]|nr:hypothetical protein [Acidimicrobiales bacterium]